MSISPSTARAIALIRHRGYRGFALASDPASGKLLLIECNDTGARCLAFTPLAADAPFEIIELPDMAGAIPAALWQAGVEARRLAARKLH